MLNIQESRDDRSARKGKTVIMDFGPDMHGWTGRHGLADLLEAAGAYIDAAKIWTLNAITLPDDFVKQSAKQYRDAGIEVFAGGLLFEYAYLKNDIDGLIARLQHLAIPGIELSENYITLDEETRYGFIASLRAADLNVVFEYGRKIPDAPLDIPAFERTLDRVRDLGVDHVILEQGEIDLLDQERPGEMDEMAKAPWFEHVFLEVESDRFPRQHADLIARFGPGVNLANVAPGHVIRLENLRRGRGRPIDNPFFKELVATFEEG